MKETIETQRPTPNGWIKPDWPAPKPVHAFVTTRVNTLSNIHPQHGYSGFNLALHVGDDKKIVMQNRALFAEQLTLASNRLCWLNQVHGQHIISAQYQLTSSEHTQTADGCDTQEKNIACIVMTADCLPVLLCDKSGTHVAAIHAGWRSLASGILTKAVKRFSHPEAVMAWLGPAISQKHFEVGSDVYGIFSHANAKNKTAFIKTRAQQIDQPQKWLADIYHLARIQLQASGVTQLYGGGFCTFGDKENFYSYRRDGSESGRMASVIYFD